MKSELLKYLVLSLAFVAFGCEPSDGGESEEEAGEMMAGETEGGEAVAGEEEAGETMAGEEEAGETVAGEEEAGQEVVMGNGT